MPIGHGTIAAPPPAGCPQNGKARAAAGDADLADRAAVLEQHIEAVGKGERHAFHDRQHQVSAGGLRAHAEEDAARVRIIVRRALPDR